MNFNINTIKKTINLFILCVFFLSAQTALADYEADFQSIANSLHIKSMRRAYGSIFFPPLHSPANAGKNDFSSTIMPLIYLLNEKYQLYSDESASNSPSASENYSKYLAKADNLATPIMVKLVSDHLASPFKLFNLDLFANLAYSHAADFYLSAEIKHRSLPVALSIMDSNLAFEHYLVYHYISCDEYNVYLIYSAGSSLLCYEDMMSKILVYDKAAARFFIAKKEGADYKAGYVYALLLHDISDIIAKFDKFDKTAGGTITFSYLFDYLKLQIEKKIIKDDKKLKSYRFFNFLSPARRIELAGLIKNVKNDIMESELATYSSKFAELKPLQIEMAEKNKREQEKAILKKFRLLNGSLEKFNIKLTPRREYDLIFKKVNIAN